MTATETAVPSLFDLSQWPLVVARFPELEEPDRVARLADGIDQLLAHQEPFVVVWLMASHDHDDEPPEDDRAAHIWLKRVRRDLNRYVRGYGYVAPSTEVRDILRERLQTVGAKLFDFPTFVSTDRQDVYKRAAEWLERF